MRRFARTASLVALFGLAFAAGWVRLPYYAVGPGPAQDVAPLIDVQGVPRYESRGALIMTTIRWYQVTALQSLIAWIDDSKTVVEEDVIYPPGVDRELELERSISQMDQSKIDASVVVLEALFDYPEKHGEGALIQSTGEDCPAAGQLFAGDLITAIDGEPVGSLEDAQRAIDDVPVDEAVAFRVHVGDEVHDVEITRARCTDLPRPLVGIRMVDAFPFEIEIASGDIGGPSAGLMFALGLYDTLTSSDLTGGHTIAGTGTIDLGGDVGGISGIVDKVIGAERAGASVFLVPAENRDELRGVDAGEMRLITVDTFQDAVEALEEL